MMRKEKSSLIIFFTDVPCFVSCRPSFFTTIITENDEITSDNPGHLRPRGFFLLFIWASKFPYDIYHSYCLTL